MIDKKVKPTIQSCAHLLGMNRRHSQSLWLWCLCCLVTADSQRRIAQNKVRFLQPRADAQRDPASADHNAHRTLPFQARTIGQELSFRLAAVTCTCVSIDLAAQPDLRVCDDDDDGRSSRKSLDSSAAPRRLEGTCATQPQRQACPAGSLGVAECTLKI